MKKNILFLIVVAIGVIAITTIGCKKTSDTTVTPGDVDITAVVQANFANATTNAISIAISGDNIVIKSDGRPHHKTPYWGVGNALYEPFPLGHSTNPNGKIGVQNYTMTIPAKPNKASSHEATGMGPIGMSLNGVAIFNDREGGNIALNAGTITSFDSAGAHPAQAADYHYHVSGKYTTLDDANLVGFLRDGFPIYGRKDKDGSYPTNLDEFNGHTSATKEFPNGVYHYHTRNENYLNTGYFILKSGSYYGTKGTFGQ